MAHRTSKMLHLKLELGIIQATRNCKVFFGSDSPSVYNLLNSGRYIIFFHEFSYRLRLNDFWLWSPPPALCDKVYFNWILG